MRIDKWASAVRMVKSRSIASTFCNNWRLKINWVKIKSSKLIKIWDIIEVDFKNFIKKYEVLWFLEKRASAEVAEKFFKDLTVKSPIFDKKIIFEKMWKIGKEKNIKWRPTKKDRRKLEEMQDFGF